MRPFRHSPMGLPRHGPMGPPAFGPLVGWIGSEQYREGSGTPNRGTRSVLMLTRRSHGSTLLPLVLTAILAATALSAIAASPPPSRHSARRHHREVRCQPTHKARDEVHTRRRDGRRRQMYAVTMVSGGSWSLSCNGRSYLRATPGTRSATSAAEAPRSRYGGRTSTRHRAVLEEHAHKRYAKCDWRVAAHSASPAATKRQPPRGASVLVVSR